MNFYKRIIIVLLSLFAFSLLHLHMPDTGFSKDGCIDQKALFQGRKSVRVEISAFLRKLNGKIEELEKVGTHMNYK